MALPGTVVNLALVKPALPRAAQDQTRLQGRKPVIVTPSYRQRKRRDWKYSRPIITEPAETETGIAEGEPGLLNGA